MVRRADGHTSVHDCLQERLVDADGKEAGEICDLMINRQTGRVDFVRIAVDRDVAPAARRFIAVPWSVVTPPAAAGEAWQVRVRRKTLERMARFDAGGP